MRDELLNCEIFDTMFEAKIIIEQWRHEYNTIRPHSSLGYRPPAPVVKVPKEYLCCKNSLSVRSITGGGSIKALSLKL